MKAAPAFAIAVLIGTLSIVLAGILALSSAHVTKASIGDARHTESAGGSSHQDILTKVLPVLVAILIFFQILLPIGSAKLNVNLADPVAILCGLLFLLAHTRNGAPVWRISGLNLHIIACTLSITLALLIGLAAIGWTQWAVTNRYIGWFVLLGYGAAGAMATKFDFNKVLLTFVCVASAICAIAVARAILSGIGLTQSTPIAGLANNRNAFAFQCIMLLAAAIVYRRGSIVAIALALITIWLSASRAGIYTAAIVIVVATVMIDRSWRKILPGFILASAIPIALLLIPQVETAAPTLSGPVVALTVGHASSTAEHLKSMFDGLAMFAANPVFGAGLGAFIANWDGPYPLIIHSTLIWLLAEFGLVGAFIFVLPVVRIFLIEAKRFRSNDAAGHLLVLIITGFSAMSIFHELMYQRTFWFLLGMGLACVVPIISNNTREAESGRLNLVRQL